MSKDNALGKITHPLPAVGDVGCPLWPESFAINDTLCCNKRWITKYNEETEEYERLGGIAYYNDGWGVSGQLLRCLWQLKPDHDRGLHVRYTGDLIYKQIGLQSYAHSAYGYDTVILHFSSGGEYFWPGVQEQIFLGIRQLYGDHFKGRVIVCDLDSYTFGNGGAYAGLSGLSGMSVAGSVMAGGLKLQTTIVDDPLNEGIEDGTMFYNGGIFFGPLLYFEGGRPLILAKQLNQFSEDPDPKPIAMAKYNEEQGIEWVYIVQNLIYPWSGYLFDGSSPDDDWSILNDLESAMGNGAKYQMVYNWCLLPADISVSEEE